MKTSNNAYPKSVTVESPDNSSRSNKAAQSSERRQSNKNPVKRDLSDFIYTNTNEPHHLQMDKPMYLSDAQIPNNNNNDNDNFIKDYNQQSNDEQDYKMEKNRNDADNYPVKKPISLTEWLATNDLPDSKALSASYEKYMHSNKHSIHCLDGKFRRQSNKSSCCGRLFLLYFFWSFHILLMW
ncbi:unnamed protein product [Trichobilharzia regenti]|nr:unnamed protein product [Trichobilharzia regenti]